MEFITLEPKHLKEFIDSFTKKELIKLIDFFESLIDFDKKYSKYREKIKSKQKRNSTAKYNLVELLTQLLQDVSFIQKAHAKLMQNDISQYLYQKLVWEHYYIRTDEFKSLYDYPFKNISLRYYEKKIYPLKDDLFIDNLSLINRSINFYYDTANNDTLFIEPNIREFLKLLVPTPKDYQLNTLTDIQKCSYTYNNEEGVLDFIDIIYPMLQNNLVEFGKTEIKPLTKTLTLLKNSSNITEFYKEKKLNTLATDMLTRSFYNCYKEDKKIFEQPVQKVLKDFVHKQFDDIYDFMISRIFLSHLKKVRFDNYYQSQHSLFSFLNFIIYTMPQEDFVSIDNIIHFAQYRNIEIDIDHSRKRYEYYLDATLKENDEVVDRRIYLDEEQYYQKLMFEPIVKASLFFLGALGVFELHYNDPKTPNDITAQNKHYISVWDSLQYIQLTKLGKYIFGFEEEYSRKKQTKKSSQAKFDEFKPIITVDPSDTLTKAKIEAYTEPYSQNKYILSYNKIFKDLKSKKALEIKIKNFYTSIEENPPQIFKDFFNEILQNANLLKRDLKQVVIELQNNKKLLELFIKNKKLKEMIIKAEGYRILVLKENIPKVTKIVKENGFFVEF